MSFCKKKLEKRENKRNPPAMFNKRKQKLHFKNKQRNTKTNTIFAQQNDT